MHLSALCVHSDSLRRPPPHSGQRVQGLSPTKWSSVLLYPGIRSYQSPPVVFASASLSRFASFLAVDASSSHLQFSLYLSMWSIILTSFLIVATCARLPEFFLFFTDR